MMIVNNVGGTPYFLQACFTVADLDGDDVWLDGLDQREGRGGHCEAVLQLGGDLVFTIGQHVKVLIFVI